jgi:hypothetical protein
VITVKQVVLAVVIALVFPAAKVTQTEAEQTYATLKKLLNKDGRLNPTVVRGYLDVLRQEQPIPADVDPQKFLDFSMLPPAR